MSEETPDQGYRILSFFISEKLFQIIFPILNYLTIEERQKLINEMASAIDNIVTEYENIYGPLNNRRANNG